MRSAIWMLMLCAVISMVACGKKAPPRILEPVRPGIPANLTAVVRPTETTIAWDRRGKAVKYEVMRRCANEPDTVMITNTTRVEDRASTVACSYTVISVSSEGVPSERSKAIELQPMPAMAAPDALSVTITNEGAHIAWKSGESQFAVYRAEGEAAFGPEPLAKVKGGSFDDKPMPGDVRYAVRGARYGFINDTVRYEGPQSAELKVALSAYVPSKLVGLKVFRKDADIVVLWNESPERWVTGYEIMREASGQSTVIRARVAALTDTSSPQGEVSYRVRAIGPGGEGPVSDTVRVGPQQ